MRLCPLSTTIGVEVLDVDLARFADDRSDEAAAVVGEIRAAWLRHHLVLFRGQRLSPAQQAQVAAWFGPIEESTPQAMQRAQAAEGPVHYISNRVDGGRAGDGELEFHSDSAVREHPLRAVVLHAVDVPSVGGDTLYANCARAYETLPPSLKNRIRGCAAHHGYDYDRTEKSPPGGPGFHGTHPVALPHPLTGQPVLYLSRNSTTEIVGLPVGASDALLEELFSYIESPALIYRHHWLVGDVVVWDNVALVHARTPFDPNEARTLQRVTVSGVPPTA
jgi:alpha-ketoglutarate-dependent taurine dioxygenase